MTQNYDLGRDMPQVVILAGGLGTRLGDFTVNTPKSLVKVNNKPIINHILDWVKGQGCKDILILTGHLGEQFTDFYYPSLNLDFIQEPEPLGTGGALWNAVDKLADDFILLWGDDLHPIDYKPLVVKHRKKQSLMTMTVTQQHEIMNLQHHNDLVIAYDKNNQNDHFNGYEAGTSIVSKKLVLLFGKSGKWSWEERVYPALSGKIHAHIDDTKFWDIGTPERLSKLDNFLKHGRP